MKITEIFKQANNKLITFDEVYETVECLKKAMKANPVIGVLPQLEIFDPLATFSHKFPNDFMTFTEIMKIKCCFEEFLEPYLPEEQFFEEPGQPITVTLDGCTNEPYDSEGGMIGYIFPLTVVATGDVTGTWESTNPSVVFVSEDGIVTTFSTGEATISFIPDQETEGNLSCTVIVI